MNEKEFIEAVKKNVKGLLPTRYWYPNVEFKVRDVTKISGTYTGLIVTMPGTDISPVINLSEIYEQCKNIKNMSVLDAVIQTAKIITERLDNLNYLDINIGRLMDYQNIKNTLYVSVCPLNGRERLRDIPHINMQDIPLIVKIQMGSKPEAQFSTTVTNELLKLWSISREELFNDAITNTRTIKPVMFNSMLNVLRSISRDVTSSEIRVNDNYRDEMYVLSNINKTDGAAAIFCTGVMDEIAREVGSNYYIIPSSIHETIIVPVNNITQETMESVRILSDMVREVNKEMNAYEILSDELYHYDAKMGIFEKASDYIIRLEKDKVNNEKNTELDMSVYAKDSHMPDYKM